MPLNLLNHVRVEIAGDPPLGSFTNLAINPNGDLGGAGWVSPVAGSRFVTTAGADRLEYRTVKGVANYFWTDEFNVTPGQWVGGTFFLLSIGTGMTIRARWHFTGVGQGPQTVALAPSTVVRQVPPMQVPANAVKARLYINVYGDTGTANPRGWQPVRFNRVMIVQAATQAAATAPTFSPVEHWRDITPHLTNEVRFTRRELDPGTLTAYTRNQAVVGPLLKTGRRVRVSAYDPAQDVWEPLFIGTMQRPQIDVDQRLAARNHPKAARLQFDCVDDHLALTKSQAGGYLPNSTSLPFLPNMLEGAGVPWSVAGNTSQTQALAWHYLAPAGTPLLEHLARLRATALHANLYVEAFLTRRSVLQVRWRVFGTPPHNFDTDFQLIPDPTFTQGIDAWSSDSANVASIAWAQDSSSGQFCLAVAAWVAGEAQVISDPVTVRPGNRILSSAHSTTTANLNQVTDDQRQIVWLGRDGAIIDTTPWHRGPDHSSPTYTAPPGTVAARLRLKWTFTGSPPGGRRVFNARLVRTYHGSLTDADVSTKDIGDVDDHLANDLTAESWFTSNGQHASETYAIGTGATSVATNGRRTATAGIVAIRANEPGFWSVLRNNLLTTNAPWTGLRRAVIPLNTPERIAAHAFWDICDRIDNPWSPEHTTVVELTHSISPTRGWLLEITTRQQEIPVQ